MSFSYSFEPLLLFLILFDEFHLHFFQFRLNFIFNGVFNFVFNVEFCLIFFNFI
jgi:hypothetical protein